MTRLLIPAVETPPFLPYGPWTRLSGASMGTSWTVQAYLPASVTDGDAGHAITVNLASVVDEMSQWETRSFINRFNAAPPGSWIDAPRLFRTVLDEAIRIARLSDGAFNPALGRLVDLWGFGSSDPSRVVPSPEALVTMAAGAAWRDIAIEGERVFQPGVALDFSGIAKGYAVDLVAGAIRDLGAPSGLVEIGGELKGWGVKEDGAPWWVELEALPGSGGPKGLNLALHELAVATSGDFRRMREIGGRRMSHTLDPQTGAPLGPEAPALVSVAHASCMTADALATALGVMGIERGLAFAERYAIAVRFLTRHGGEAAERLSPALAAMLT